MKALSIIESDCSQWIPNIDFRSLDKKRILITGASGLLGTYFLGTLKILRDQGIDLHVDAMTYSEVPDYWSDWLNVKWFQFIRGDLSSHSFISSLPSYDVIIHSGGFGQPGKFMIDPVKTIEINTSSLSQLFKKLNPDGRLLFVSTSELYVGAPQANPREEDIGMTPTQWPRAPYIESKRCGEALCLAYGKYGLQSKVVRLALGYGPGTKLGDARVLHSFIERALKSGRIELLDQGQAIRTYCYASDAVEMMWNLFLHGRHQIYNVGGISRTSIADLARLIGNLTGAETIIPALSTIDTRINKGAPDDVRISIDRYLEEFKKSHFIELKEGLKRTIAWQHDILRNETMKEISPCQISH